MSVGSLLRSAYLLYFSRPAADRALYKALRGRPIRSIVELGISQIERTRRLIEVAGWHTGCLPIRYTGIDLFEARANPSAGLTLKQAFAALKQPKLQVQLVPGDPATALRRVANSLTNTDLLLIAADSDHESLARAWTWMPRMLSATSLIFIQEPTLQPGEMKWRPLKLADIERMVAAAGKMRRAA